MDHEGLFDSPTGFRFGLFPNISGSSDGSPGPRGPQQAPKLQNFNFLTHICEPSVTGQGFLGAIIPCTAGNRISRGEPSEEPEIFGKRMNEKNSGRSEDQNAKTRNRNVCLTPVEEVRSDMVIK